MAHSVLRATAPMILWVQRFATSFRNPGRLLRKLSAPQLFVASFALVIAAATVGFMVLPGLYTGNELSWSDALFTATSAVCVTGLIVVDTATYFTPWGQAYILLLIQLGGLGILSFTTIILTALGVRLSLRHEAISRSPTEIAPHIDFRKLARHILTFTFTIEAVGATILFLFWLPFFSTGEALWHSVFHSISAFCNAGFSTFTTSLMGFRAEPQVICWVMGLIVIGGIGFLTLEELFIRYRGRGEGRPPKISLHTKIVLVSTAVLLSAGWGIFAIIEWNVSLEGLAFRDKIWNSLFMSVTARTAGFNTVDYATMTDGGNFLTILLMSIGGSPGSTAGGLKTTTAAIIFLVALSRLRGYRITMVAGRSIPEETVQRSIGLFVLGFGVVTAAIFVFTVAEISWIPHDRVEGRFLKYMFEAVSAFNTVGLSMGATAELSGTGKFLTTLLMFLGRVGPLTFAAALARRYARVRGEFYYAYEDVAIG